jgi:hypothetical protein
MISNQLTGKNDPPVLASLANIDKPQSAIDVIDK